MLISGIYAYSFKYCLINKKQIKLKNAKKIKISFEINRISSFFCFIGLLFLVVKNLNQQQHTNFI